MRLLILSESIRLTQSFGKAKFEPPNDVHLAVGNLNDADSLPYSVFDYDVTILHIHPSRYHSLGYLRNIPKVAIDTSTALEHGRSVICLPQSKNFRPETDRERGDPIYDWLKLFGLF